jgi:hypothetical protein
MKGAAAQHAVVTSAGPLNGTVFAGDDATLSCRVKALKLPHIKWLKKLDSNDPRVDERIVNVNTLNMGKERYRVLETDPDIVVGDGEFLNKLIIRSTSVEDSGMYLCFVTNSGYGALTYKSTFLRVVPNLNFPPSKKDIATVPAATDTDKDTYVLYLVIGIIVVTFVFAISVVICVIKHSQSSKSTSSMKPEAEDDSLNQQRPFLMAGDLKFDAVCGGVPATLPPPPPPSSLFPSSGSGHWSRTVYPLTFSHHQQQQQQQPRFNKAQISTADSHYENPFGSKYNLRRTADSPVVVNQYEVPYSHLSKHTPPPPPSVFAGAAPAAAVGKGSSIGSNSNNSLNPLLHHQQQQRLQQNPEFQTTFSSNKSQRGAHVRYSPQGGSAALIGTYQSELPHQQDNNSNNHFRSYPYFQYMNDYEA